MGYSKPTPQRARFAAAFSIHHFSDTLITLMLTNSHNSKCERKSETRTHLQTPFAWEVMYLSVGVLQKKDVNVATI